MADTTRRGPGRPPGSASRRIERPTNGASDDAQRTHAPAQGVGTEELSDDLFRVLAQLGASGDSVTLWKEKDDRRGVWEFVTTYSAGEFADNGLTTVRDTFGGGDYKLIGTDAKLGPLNAVFFSIDRRYKGTAFAVVPSDNGTPSRAPADTFRDELLRTLLQAVLLQRAAPAPAAQQSSAKDTVELVTAIARVFAPGQNQQTPPDVLKAAVDMFAQGVKIGTEAGGPPPEGVAAALSAFAPILERLTGMAAARANNGQRAPMLAPAPDVPPTEEPPPMAQTNGVPEWLAPFASPMLLGYALRKADTDADGGGYADAALNELQESPPAFARVTELVTTGGADALYNELTTALPAFAQTEARQKFAREFADALAEGVKQMQAEDTAAPE